MDGESSGAPLPDWDSELNPEQREAVEWDGGPIVVFAGAGSGKTRVITYRIVHLVRARGIRPSRIVGLTFTNKAAGEMRERVQEFMPEGWRPPWLGTFHAFCARMLRIHGQKIGIPDDFTIIDEQDQLSLIKRIVKEANLDTELWTPRRIKARIESMKREGGVTNGEKRVVARVLEAYEKHLAAQGGLDFSDLILRAVDLLERDRGEGGEIAARWDHVLVDEFQDTNRMQMRLLRLMAPPPRANLCVVGDDDQSIYGWRGADVRNILDFGKHYRGARVVTLSRNYRSTGNILQAASAVIEGNRDRAPKKLWTDAGAGAPASLFVASSETAEAGYVVEKILERQDGGVALGEQAVLYRIHAQSRAIEEALREKDLGYRIVGGVAFFARVEIRDLVAYLRVAANPADDVALARIINTPPRGIGKKSLEVVRRTAARRRGSLMEACRACTKEGPLGGRARRALSGLAEAAGRWNEMSRSQPVHAVLDDVLRETEFEDHLVRAHGPESETRLLNVRELGVVAHDFDLEHPGGSLPTFLEQIALQSSIDGVEEDADRVLLMTVHSAKGLEFDTVYVTGLEEGLFPYHDAWSEEDSSPEDIRAKDDEERRLFYVAVTRARHKLVLTCTRKRRLFGTSARYRSPSRFLDAIPREILTDESWSTFRQEDPSPRSMDRNRSTARPRRSARRREPATRPAGHSLEGEGTRITPGTIVRHGKFGRGRVVKVDGSRPRRFTIRFDDGRTRKILEGFVEKV